METLWDMFTLYVSKDESRILYAIDNSEVKKWLDSIQHAEMKKNKIEAYRVKDYSIKNKHINNYSLESDEFEYVEIGNLEPFKIEDI